mgnify:CR=1 FL=1
MLPVGWNTVVQATLGLSQKEISGRILETFPLLLSRMPKTGHHLAALWDSMTEWHGRLPVTSPFKMQGLSLFAHMAKVWRRLSPSVVEIPLHLLLHPSPHDFCFPR